MTRAVQTLDAGRRTRPQERGYILLTLLLMVSLLIIGAAVIAPNLAFQIRRDREEELVHRGVQYTRAIRGYAKRTGRYPVRTEELLGGPDLRYIRKLYKDPITGGEFKLLHLGDVQPGQALNLNSSGDPSSGGPSSSDPSSNDPSSGERAAANDADDPAKDTADAAGPNTPRPTSLARSNTPFSTSASAAASSNSGGPNSGTSGGQPGLLIFGVVSKSKARSIREFDRKDHYNDWLFYYDPSVDRGYEIKGPTSRTPQTFPGRTPGLNQNPNQPGPFGQQQPQSAPQPQDTPVSQ